VLILDADGQERWRIEGYLPNREFRAELEMGLARVAAARKQWAEAQQWYAHVASEYGDTSRAPEALYWRWVSEYNHTRDHTVLGNAERELRERYPNSQEALKASVWAA
jgi:TolA-binding protein